jgi:thiosulfate reductase cytochrome b subunit
MPDLPEIPDAVPIKQGPPTNTVESGEVLSNPTPGMPDEFSIEIKEPAGATQSVPWHYRHALLVRISHWLNVLCVPILIMSGLQIFNAHPALYWGERSDRDRPVLAMRAVVVPSGERKGVTIVAGHVFDTTSVLGFSDGRQRGFPSWATLPSQQWLAMGRRWHLFFAWVFVINGVIFGLYAFFKGHFWQDLFPHWRDLRKIGRTMLDHLLFRHPTGEEAKHYNVLQKIAYTGVIFGLGPLIVLTGLSMSPMIDAAFPWLLTVFGGRQSARTIHFIACFAFIGFIVIHLTQVVLTGLWNNIRSIVTGWYRVPEDGEVHENTKAD